MTPEQQAAVVQEATTWLGTPYHHCADVKGGGVDCLMILCAVFCTTGLVPWTDPRPYPTDWMLHHSAEIYLAGLERHADRVPGGETPQPGDVLTFRFARTHSHAAIVTEWPMMVHAYRRAGKVVLDNALGEDFKGRAGPVYRVRVQPTLEATA
jgi:NlpC/P60 family putative phage cell wall peptidase